MKDEQYLPLASASPKQFKERTSILESLGEMRRSVAEGGACRHVTARRSKHP